MLVTAANDPVDVTLADVLRRIDAASAALPARPHAALRELDAAREALTARLSPPAAPTADGVKLTTRERQVLLLLAQGDRNKEIALRLGLRERTIKFHVSNLFAKLNAQSRTEALRRALELGIVPSAPGSQG
ncbi:MAG: response regulator transcription factor [Dehalococcoidia bacterium]